MKNVKKETKPMWVLLFLVSIASVFIVPDLSFSIVGAIASSPLRFLWNCLVLYFAFSGIYAILLFPLLVFVLPEQSKLGQKLEWYDDGYKHLDPNRKKQHNNIRYNALFFLVAALFFTRESYFLGYLVNIAPLKIQNNEAFQFAKLLDDHGLPHFSSFFAFCAFSYVMLITESRTRALARFTSVIIARLDNVRWWTKIKESRDKNKDFSIDIGAVFLSDEGKIVLDKETPNEKKISLGIKTLLANTAVITPTGGGKTQGIILPSLDAAMAFLADDPKHKQAGAVYDPKAELTEHVQRIAKKYKRESDLVILKRDGKFGTNVIRARNIWDGETAPRIASLIKAAQLNFQGKASGDPYWDSQNSSLFTHMLTALYAEKGAKASMEDIADYFLDLAEGFYVDAHSINDDRKKFTAAGRRLLVIRCAVMDNISDIRDILDNFRYAEDNSSSNYSDIVVENATERLEEERERFFEENALLDPKMIQLDIDSKRAMIAAIENTGDSALEQIKMIEQSVYDLERKREQARAEQNKNDNKWSSRFSALLEIESIIEDSGLIGEEIFKSVKEQYYPIEKRLKKEDLPEYSMLRKSKSLNNAKMKRIMEIERAATDLNSHQNKVLKDHLKRVKRMIMSAIDELREFAERPPQQRSSVLSTAKPFLQIFKIPEYSRILSCSEDLPDMKSVDFTDLITNGKILVPSFNDIQLGAEGANALITLIKGRWQNEVLDVGQGQSEKKGRRLIFQIIDEAQRVISLGDQGNDFGFMEVSRSFNCYTIMCSQSDAALKAKASKAEYWDKAHGVIRSWIFSATTDPHTMETIRKVSGQHNVLKRSRTVQEGANSPSLNVATEKYTSKNSSLSVSWTDSETREDRIPPEVVQNLGQFCSIGIIYEGKIKTYRISHKPYFWKWKRDKWQLLEKADFEPKNRKFVRSIGLVKDLIFTPKNEEYYAA